MKDLEEKTNEKSEKCGSKQIQVEADTNFLLCSSCFRDEGLKTDAYKIGIESSEKCPNCNSVSGHKLTKNLVNKLCYSFFVRGSIFKCEYGGTPLIQFNAHHYGNSDIDVAPWLANDLELLEDAGEIGLFKYGPAFWRVGEIEPIISFSNAEESRKLIDKIVTQYPVRELTEKEYLYRLRINPGLPEFFDEYESASGKFSGNNRFDCNDFPVMYCSQDLELCLHECRTTVEDEIYVAKLIPTKKLKVLDLTAVLEEKGVTEYESINIAIHFLFFAGKHSYKICRKIAIKAKEKGFDGIIFPSCFSYMRSGTLPFEDTYGFSIMNNISKLNKNNQSTFIPNIVLFGQPITEGKVKIDCVNKVIINKVSYDVSFGTVYSDEFCFDQ